MGPKEKLITILESFKYLVILQGSLGKDEAYPDHFFTFWNNSADDGSHYDNDAINFIWSFDVMFYSIDPALVNTILIEARAKLKAEGFIVQGVGYDLPSDEPTHTGRGFTVLYIQNNKE